MAHITPSVKKNIITIIKVSALTKDRYAHLRQCSYTFEPLFSLPGESPEPMYDIIFNGCSANVPLTIMSETRDTFEYDSFGQILFMNEDFKKSKFRLSCIVDACIPPDMGRTIADHLWYD